MSITIRCTRCGEGIDVSTESERDGASLLVSLKTADLEAHGKVCAGGGAE